MSTKEVDQQVLGELTQQSSLSGVWIPTSVKMAVNDIHPPRVASRRRPRSRRRPSC